MVHAHPAALWLMVASAIAAALCCLAAGRTVPWQGRQGALAMAVGMILLAIVDQPVATLAVAAAWVLSAMVGTAGLRGHPAAAACCHRGIAGVVMAACALSAMPGAPGVGVSGAGHFGHGAPSLVLVTGLATGVIVVWTIVGHRRAFIGPRIGRPVHRPGRMAGDVHGRWAAGEAVAMTVGVVVMWAAHV